MTIDVQNFLHQLAIFIGATADVEYADRPAELFLHEMVETDSTLAAATPTPAAVLCVYGGESPIVPVQTVSCQLKTIGVTRQNAAAMSFHQALHGTLLDSSKRPLRMKVLPTSGSPLFRINGVLNLRGPQAIGRDDEGKAEIVTNFDVEFVPLT